MIELLLPQHGSAAAKEQWHMHPLDYELLQQAAQSQKQSLADFIALATYLHARDVLTEIAIRRTAAAASSIQNQPNSHTPRPPVPST